uniref:Uncharacterized protein n=1 Tax=Cyprinus carpio TaxID=7962 RepID=A0A8C2BBS6_CYPCA
KEDVQGAPPFFIRGKAKGQENVTSSLLSSQENERLLELLGRRCVVSEDTLIKRPIADGHSHRGCFGDINQSGIKENS